MFFCCVGYLSHLGDTTLMDMNKIIGFLICLLNVPVELYAVNNGMCFIIYEFKKLQFESTF